MTRTRSLVDIPAETLTGAAEESAAPTPASPSSPRTNQSLSWRMQRRLLCFLHLCSDQMFTLKWFHTDPLTMSFDTCLTVRLVVATMTDRRPYKDIDSLCHKSSRFPKSNSPVDYKYWLVPVVDYCCHGQKERTARNHHETTRFTISFKQRETHVNCKAG